MVTNTESINSGSLILQIYADLEAKHYSIVQKLFNLFLRELKEELEVEEKKAILEIWKINNPILFR